MLKTSGLTDASLLSNAVKIAERLGRQVVQEALVDSRLIPRTTDREEVRRFARNQSAWTGLVRTSLETREKRSAALRAMGLLVNAYLRLPGIDNRVENCFRKAHQAAERGDSQRLQREVERLADLTRSLRSEEIKEPIVMLYVWAGSEQARDRIADLASSAPLEQGESSGPYIQDGTASPVVDNSTATRETKSEFVSQPVDSDFIRELRNLSQPLAPSKPLEWNLAELLRQEPLPPASVPWPTTTQVTSDLKNLQQAAQAVVEISFGQGDVAIEALRALHTRLQDPIAVLAQSSQVLESFTTLESSAVTIANNHADRLDDLVKADAQEAVALLAGDADSWCTGVRSLDNITSSAFQSRESRRAAILDLARNIANIAVELPSDRQGIVEHKVRYLARRERLDEMRKVHDEVVLELTQVRAHHGRIQDLATKVLQQLAARHGELPEQLRALILEAVQKGDSESVSVLLRQAQAAPQEPNQTRPPESVFKVDRSAGSIDDSVVVSAPPPLQSDKPSISRPLRTFPFPIHNFRPRDRLSQRQIPKEPTELMGFLLQRALQEMRRGSILGVIDHAIDILSAASIDPIAGAPWSDIGLALLAALPATINAFQEWGETLAEDISASLESADAPLFPKFASTLISRPSFAQAISERFTHKEVSPFSSVVASTFYTGVCRHSPYLLQDLCCGIAEGARHGDPNVAKALLVGVAGEHGMEAAVLQKLRDALNSTDPRLTTSIKGALPVWLLEGVQNCSTMLTDARGSSAPRGTLNVQVPPSVQSAGGFIFVPDSDVLEIALLVGNPQALHCVSAELVLSTERNSWLARDAVAYLGALPPLVRLLAPLRLHFKKELTEPRQIEVLAEVRYKDTYGATSKFQDVKRVVTLQRASTLQIDDYSGASGEPLILHGDALRLSSESVKNALADITRTLKKNPLGALILGRRRRGKTSILTTIARYPDIRANYVIIEDKLEDLPFSSLAEALSHFGNILDRAARYLDVQIDPIEPLLSNQPHLGWTTIQEWLAQISLRLTEPKRVLLLLDEFQKWLSLLDIQARTRILAIFRGLMNRPRGETLSIAIILFGLPSIREYTRTSADFINAFRIYEVRAFNRDEAAALIRSNPTIEFDARSVSRISELSGGNPFLINLLGNDIASRLRQHGRPYCFPDDVERVVQSQLDDRLNSRVWSFLEYLLKQGEEDHASEIGELPGLRALAWTLKTRGSRRPVAVEEIAEEFRNLGVECDSSTLVSHLDAGAQNELIIKQGERYTFSSSWLGEWLGVMVGDVPAPVKKIKDLDLILNRYRIVEQLDRGGQATVYLGSDTVTHNSPVILKVYPRIQGNACPSISEREAKALCSIQHNGVVKCYFYGTDPEKGDIVVLERVKGESLRSLLTSRPKTAADLCGAEGKIGIQVKLLEQLATALAECHAAGVVHKDLKPENILVEQSAGIWSPKIIDFGIASAAGEPGQAVPTVGPYTPGYVAPERYRGEPRRAASDIYSLGVVAYELLTGVTPFPADPVAGMKAQQEGRFRPIRELRPNDVSLRLAELVESMLSPNPLDRPNAQTLASILPVAVQAADWKEFCDLGRAAYLEGDSESAFEHLEKAAFTASEKVQHEPEYIQTLELLVDCALDCKRIVDIAPQLVQPVLRCVLQNDQGREFFEKFVSGVVHSIHVTADTRSAVRTALGSLLELLLDHEPKYSLASGVGAVLKSVSEPTVWENRESVYEVAVNYKLASLMSPGLLESWCVAASRIARERNAPIDESQLWLRRAERLGVATNPEFLHEAAEVDKILRHTANARELPALPAAQEDAGRTVGEDERGHLNVNRIRLWVTRLLNRHPYVQAVRRVRKDHGLALRPTRILELSNIGQHIVGVQKMDVNRIIPAVLDESYCSPSGTTVLRINVVLAEGTSPRQRECAFQRLRMDDALFGEDA